MRIMKKGPRRVGRRKQCGHCGVTVEYVLKDIQEGGPDGSRWIICPSCGGTIILERW